MNIIIADHDIILRKKLRKILEDNHYSVVDEATNGLHIYNKYVAHEPDLVIISLQMPIFNSLDTIERILLHNNRALIVVIATQNQKKLVFDALEKGAVHYLMTPYVNNRVVGVIEEMHHLLEERRKYV